MRKVAFISILVISLAVCLALFAGLEQTSPTLDESADLMPGSTRYRVYWCDYQHTTLSTLYCEAFYNDQIVSLVLRGKRISVSTWPVQSNVVADFIVLWRTPSGIYYSHETQIVRIYWGSTAVWLLAKHFGPDSRVYYVTYGATPDAAVQPWMGFVLPRSAD